VAQILWKETDEAYYGYEAGEQWTIVRLGSGGGGGGGVKMAHTTSTISAKSGMTLGTGTAKLYDSYGGTLEEAGSIVARNGAPAPVADDRDIIVARCDGLWLVITEFCPPPEEYY
jgi:hypothetical protein